MFCPQCGVAAAPGYRFCTRCGSALTAAPAPPTPTAGVMAAVDVFAGFWPRTSAFLIDYLLVVLVCVLLRGLLGIRLDSPAVLQAFFWATVLVLWLYKAVAERSERQASLGKLAFDLKVTSLNGERIGLTRALVRNFAQTLSGLIAFIGFLMPAFTRRHQALHDMIAGTVVTRRQYTPEVIATAADAATASSFEPALAAGPARSAPPPQVPAAAVARPAREPRPVARPARPARQTNTPSKILASTPAKSPSNTLANTPANTPTNTSRADSVRPARVAARPSLPVRLSFKDALIGTDKRAVLENLSDSALEVVLDVKSPVTGAHFSRTFVINPRSFGQVGRAQGWPFAPGQLVTVSNPEYRPLVQTVS